MQKYLFDALKAIEQIEEYFAECKNFGEYQSAPMLQDATERNLEIIGEAMKKVLAGDQNFKFAKDSKYSKQTHTWL